MNRNPLMILTLAASLLLAACAPVANTNTATTTNSANANAAKLTAAAPTVDTLFAMDKAANEAWIKGDTKFFDDMLSDKFVSYEMGMRMSKDEMLAMMKSMKCEMKSHSLDDPQMSMINADTAVISYKGTFDGSCTDGKDTMKMPSPVRAASIYVRDGDKWKGVYHGETMIIDPQAAPAAPAKPAGDKKAEAKPADAKKNADATAMAEDPAGADTKAAPSANTDALVKLHQTGWEAFKAKDAKKFDEMLTANASIVSPIGTWMSGKANLIKQWTDTMKCEGITNIKVSDGVSTSLSPTVELLTIRGTADGTCEGQKNTPLNQSAVYVKEGDAWKLAFMFEAPDMAM